MPCLSFTLFVFHGANCEEQSPPCCALGNHQRKENGLSLTSFEAVGNAFAEIQREARDCARDLCISIVGLKLPTFRRTIALQRYVLSDRNPLSLLSSEHRVLYQKLASALSIPTAPKLHDEKIGTPSSNAIQTLKPRYAPFIQRRSYSHSDRRPTTANTSLQISA